MDDEVAAFLITGLWAMAAYILYLKLFVIRRLRRKLDQQIEQALAARVPAPPPVGREPDDELARVHKRLAVLERIAVEKESSLHREIEQLRAGDR